MSLVEIIPNVSEGRRAASIEAMASAFGTDDRLALLDTHSDPSHHRSVFTAAAPLVAVLESCCRLAEAAIAHVDLRVHRGAHPRIGALDILPFVPLGSTPVEKVVAVAREVGSALAGRFGLPVFLYGKARERATTLSLADLRRGGTEGLAERMADGTLVPDFGPDRPHPTAGAVAVGVRDFLIAYNVELESKELAVARAIARKVRASSGGLRGVQALGFAIPHRDRVQVSMNLLELPASSLEKVFEAIRREAQALGTDVAGSEIVGLVPEAACFEGMEAKLMLGEPPRVLEEQLRRRGLL